MRWHGKNGIPAVNIRLSEDFTLYSEKETKTTEDALALIGDYVYDLPRERCFCIYVDGNLKPICIAVLGYGDLRHVSVNPRDITQIGLLCDAMGLYMIHNHPVIPTQEMSGDAVKPSTQDYASAELLVRTCALVDLRVLDDIILGKAKNKYGQYESIYYSLKKGKVDRLSKWKCADIVKDTSGMPAISRLGIKWDPENALNDYLKGALDGDPAEKILVLKSKEDYEKFKRVEQRTGDFFQAMDEFRKERELKETAASRGQEEDLQR
jgi:hypothetical protein